MGEIVATGSKYSDEDRRRAVLEYSIYGVMSKVSKSTGIPEPTLSKWKNSDWWVSLRVEVETEKEEHILAQHTAIVEKVGEEIQDRLDNGDTQLVQGKPVKVPVKARDLALVGGISFDKRRLILNQPTSITDKSANMDVLLKQFEQIARESRDRIVSEQ